MSKTEPVSEVVRIITVRTVRVLPHACKAVPQYYFTKTEFQISKHKRYYFLVGLGRSGLGRQWHETHTHNTSVF